ncbi:hypothetical protein AA313_de0202082 [Arthrobotrys entomopaga]|nr:hypothetical protein AA313_de0202082 [Arthrobotrys entomopaga]
MERARWIGETFFPRTRSGSSVSNTTFVPPHCMYMSFVFSGSGCEIPPSRAPPPPPNNNNMILYPNWILRSSGRRTGNSNVILRKNKRESYNMDTLYTQVDSQTVIG